jgi:hypothetical protein
MMPPRACVLIRSLCHSFSPSFSFRHRLFTVSFYFFFVSLLKQLGPPSPRPRDEALQGEVPCFLPCGMAC